VIAGSLRYGGYSRLGKHTVLGCALLLFFFIFFFYFFPFMRNPVPKVWFLQIQ